MLSTQKRRSKHYVDFALGQGLQVGWGPLVMHLSYPMGRTRAARVYHTNDSHWKKCWTEVEGGTTEHTMDLSAAQQTSCLISFSFFFLLRCLLVSSPDFLSLSLLSPPFEIPTCFTGAGLPDKCLLICISPSTPKLCNAWLSSTQTSTHKRNISWCFTISIVFSN